MVVDAGTVVDVDVDVVVVTAESSPPMKDAATAANENTTIPAANDH